MVNKDNEPRPARVVRVGIAADHRGFRMKRAVAEYLGRKGMRVLDFGTNSEESTDYPLFGFPVACAVAQRKLDAGVLLCYSGQGMTIVANKVRGIRAALAFTPRMARLARAHNNANVLVMPATFARSPRRWKAIIDAFFTTPFEGGRHRRRLALIAAAEKRGATGPCPEKVR